MKSEIEDFILFLATERGLSDNYQLSTRQSLETLADWLAKERGIQLASKVGTKDLTDYLAERKHGGLSPSSLRLIVVAMKVFFRRLAAEAMGYRGRIPRLAMGEPLRPVGVAP